MITAAPHIRMAWSFRGCDSDTRVQIRIRRRLGWTAPLWRKTKRNSAPVGASARSRGLQATDRIELGPKAPIGATAIFLRELLSPLSGLCELFANEPWAEAHGYALAPLSWLNRRRLLAGNIEKCSDFAQTGAVQPGWFED